MRNFGEREREGDRTRWDEEVPKLGIDKKPMRIRLVGPVQDIARHWCIIEAGKWADTLSEMRKEAISRGREFKKPRDPKGVPFLCPKFDLHRERFIDWKDTSSGDGFLNKEVLTASDLKRHGIKVRPDPEARYSPKSVEKGEAIPVVQVYCPMHDDFGHRAEKRTWWHAFERKVKVNRRTGEMKVVGNASLGIVGSSGMPATPMMAIEKIAKVRRMDPSDPKSGYDLMISLDPGQKPQDMWEVSEVRGEDNHPLTREEAREAFGRYILADGSKVTFLDVIRLKRENPSLLKGMKVIEEAALFPLEDMAESVVSSEDMKDFMVKNGYYTSKGKPRPELMEVKDENDNAWSSSLPDDEDEDEDEEDEHIEAPKAPPKKKRRQVSSKESEKGEETNKPRIKSKMKPSKPAKSRSARRAMDD